MIGSEYARPPIAGVLVQPVNSALPDSSSLAITDQEVVQDEARKCVKSVPPPRQRGGDTKREPSLTQCSPSPLVSAAPEIEIGAKNHRVVRHGAHQVSGLQFSARRAQPPMTRWASGIEMGAH